MQICKSHAFLPEIFSSLWKKIYETHYIKTNSFLLNEELWNNFPDKYSSNKYHHLPKNKFREPSRIFINLATVLHVLIVLYLNYHNTSYMNLPTHFHWDPWRIHVPSPMEMQWIMTSERLSFSLQTLELPLPWRPGWLHHPPSFNLRLFLLWLFMKAFGWTTLFINLICFYLFLATREFIISRPGSIVLLCFAYIFHLEINLK